MGNSFARGLTPNGRVLSPTSMLRETQAEARQSCRPRVIRCIRRNRECISASCKRSILARLAGPIF